MVDERVGAQCRVYLDPEEIFKCEVDETHDKLLLALVGLNTFKETYEEHRRRLPHYRSRSGVSHSDAAPLDDWEFPPQIIFHRYDRFLARLANIRVRIRQRNLRFMNDYSVVSLSPVCFKLWATAVCCTDVLLQEL